MTTLHERDLLALLLVRAVEEHDPHCFSPEVQSEAALAAVDAASDVELLEKRTSYLFLRLPRSVRAWARIALLPEDSMGAVIVAAFALGALSNYLGPSGQIHVAYNPLGFLILWNIGAYALIGARRIRRSARARSGSRPAAGAHAGEDVTAAAAAASRGHKEGRTAGGDRSSDRGFLRVLLPSLWMAWNRSQAGMRSAAGNVRNTREIATAFWDSYQESAREVMIARVESLVHIAAIGLAAGALVGTYVRGLFFEYNAVWRSTFVVEPSSVAAFLNMLLAPASLALDGRLLGIDDVRPLLMPEGDVAAAWIHRLALMGVFVVLLPRAMLARSAARRAEQAAAGIEVDLSQRYFVEKLHAAREGQIHRIRDGIASALRTETGKLAESVALFVRDRFFDKVVAPTLFQFRNRGGRICDLEEELAAHNAAFGAELQAHLRIAQRDFDDGVRHSVRGIIGRELDQPPELLGDLAARSVSVDPRGMTGSVAANVGDAIGATVTAAISATAAAISGGVGKTLGVAVVSHLLGTTGPIGLLIGGIGAAAVVGGAYVLGRDRVTSAVKTWHIPASVVALGLRDSKLERARQSTYAEVKREIESRIEPEIAPATETILRQLSLAVVSRARQGER
ncbi:MAG TPA: DUF2868 domain-containing protein [Candidatus Limnocylindrales bacterium]|nr:DUF2868 domain-containing protein [Candidatus Limnocylindrales bacterium]